MKKKCRRGFIWASPNPLRLGCRSWVGAVRLDWSAEGAEAVEVHLDAPNGPLVARSGPKGSTTTDRWVRHGMKFFLQDVSGGRALSREHTIAVTRLQVISSDEQGINRAISACQPLLPASFRRHWWTRRLGHLRGAASGSFNGALVLVYHRVSKKRPDPWATSVEPDRFIEQIEIIRRYGSPLRLGELVDRSNNGNLPPAAVAVTFDDGYADNLYVAKPVLERYDVPATFFVVADSPGPQREFWWDELNTLLLEPNELPKELSIRVAGRDYNWSLGSAAKYESTEYRRNLDWRAKAGIDPTPRHSLWRSVRNLLWRLPPNEQRRVLDELWVWAKSQPAQTGENRLLSHDEIRTLADHRLFEIGCHGRTHALLPALSIDLQRDEICTGKRVLEEIVVRRVTSFAYPHGAYSRDAVGLVEDAGFLRGCAASGGVFRPGTSVYEIPRIAVENWSADTFAKRFYGWLGASSRTAKRVWASGGP
jgi:peptidoglycan/xylan/chitin deacetylase (PgdA/CDA1 family)